MNYQKKIKTLEDEARGILQKKQQSQQLIQNYDMRLLEIQGSLKTLKEMQVEEDTEKNNSNKENKKTAPKKENKPKK